MNVKLLETGETVTVSRSYGLRLIEQGRAVAAPKSTRKSAGAAKENG